MKRTVPLILIYSLCAIAALSQQSGPPSPNAVVHVATALNHLTVLEFHEPVTMAASGDIVFVFQRITGTRKGKTLDTQAVLFFTVANGVVTEVKEFPADYPAYSHFWS